MHKNYESINTVSKMNDTICPSGFTLAPENEVCISEKDSQRLTDNAKAQFPVSKDLSEEELKRNVLVQPIYAAVLFKHLLPNGTETWESCLQQDAYVTRTGHCVCKIGYTRIQGRCTVVNSAN
jgi:hypothetical protein